VKTRVFVQIGDVFGTLTVIANTDRGPRKRRCVLCLCECGRERVVIVANLVNGNTKSCGYSPCSTRWDKLKYPPGEQAQNFIFLNYQAVARKKGRRWALTREQFNELTAAPCFYCGAAPSNRTKDRNGDGAFIYSGLDRINPALGYTITNVVPACIICNRAKTNMTLEEFEAWLQRAYSVTVKGGSRGESVASRG
jgi:hypothetical protein